MSFIEGIKKVAWRGAEVEEGVAPNSSAAYDPRLTSGYSDNTPAKDSPIAKKFPVRGQRSDRHRTPLNQVDSIR
jgi:hypothetical protein